MPRAAAELEGPLVLRDGTVVHRCAIRPGDAERLQALHGRLSRQAIAFRFFGALAVLTTDLAQRLSHVDYESRMAVVATAGTGADAPIIAVVRYARVEAGTAEIALVVEDRWQGQGLAPRLLWTLVAYACARGYSAFIANVMTENVRMLALLRHSGIPTVMRLRDGYVEARLDISRLGTP